MMYSEDKIQKLLDLGALKNLGPGEDGDDILMITKKCKNIDPDLYKFKMDYIGLAGMRLWEINVVDIYMDDGNFKLKLTPLAYNKNVLSTLKPDLRQALIQFKEMLMEE